MAMSNFHGDTHRLTESINRDQIYTARPQSARIQIVRTTDHDLLVRAADLDHIKRRSRGQSESLALTNGEIVNARMLADHFTAGGHQFARGVGECATLLRQVGIEDELVIAAGDEAYLLRVRLFGERQTVLAREFTPFGLGHASERKQSAAQLLLCKTEE